MEYVVFSKVRGKKFFKKILKKRVFSLDGRYIGYIYKIYLERKSGKPLKVLIRNGNKIITADPSHLRITSHDKIYFIEDSIWKENAISYLEDLLADLRKLREELLLLDEKFIKGELSFHSYSIKRYTIESKRSKLLVRLKNSIPAIYALLSKNVDKTTREYLIKIFGLIDKIVIELDGELSLEEFLKALS